MKKTLRNLMLGMMTLIAGSALTSCSNDDEPQAAQQEVKKGYVEFTLTRGADTRIDYTPNTDGGLDLVWKDGDQVLVSYNDAFCDEVFDIVKGAGTKTATFAREESKLAEKSGSVTILYLPGYNEEDEWHTFDFSKQEGTLANLGKYDRLGWRATLTKGKISDCSFYLTNMAILHFPEGLDFGIKAATADFVFRGGTNKTTWLSGHTKGDIIVKDVSLLNGKLSQDLYVSVWAYEGEDAPTTLKVGDYTFKLSGLDSGKVFTFVQKNLILAPSVGLLIGANGKFYINKASAEADKTTAEAMIAYLSTDRGLAIALEDASADQMKWADATQAVSDWAEKHPVEMENSFWNLPTAYDFQNMFIGCGSSSTYISEMPASGPVKFESSGFKTMLQNAGANAMSVYYWTSTACGTKYWYYNSEEDMNAFYPDDTSNYVRAVLVFQF